MTPDRLPAERSPDERFRAIRRLGRGGMGEVTLVHDELRGQVLALKRMRRVGDGNLRRFKREFRSVERLEHPNIVRVYELGVDAWGPYLLMEAIDGDNLFDWCRVSGPGEPSAPPVQSWSAALARPAGEMEPEAPESLSKDLPTATTCDGDDEDGSRQALIRTAPSENPIEAPRGPLTASDFTRLYRAVPQLISALMHLHDRRLVHRDIKPNNVLVDVQGVVKLLDFGILEEIGGWGHQRAFGTPGYVAPEQMLGEPAAPENDLYGLGAVLFEVVTGYVPFSSSHQFALHERRAANPMSARALAQACPHWLDAIIGRLLAKDVGERPSLLQVLETLERETGILLEPRQERPTRNPPEQLLLERESEQRSLSRLLEEAHGSEFRFAAISGPSGQGKSALLDWVKTRTVRRGAALFESRTRFSERVSFNAIDGWIDHLAMFVEQRGLDQDPALVALLFGASAAFPVLGQLDGLRGLSSGSAPTRDPEATFDCVIGILERCAQVARGLVLTSDDLQWADADSVRFLRRLVRRRPRGIVLLAAVRDDLHSAAFARWWPQVDVSLRIDLPQLSEAALVGIMERIAADSEGTLSLALAQAAARMCSGRAFLAVASARLLLRGEFDPERGEAPVEVLLRQYMSAGSLQRQAMALLAAIDRMVRLTDLARILRCPAGSIDDSLMPAVRERLLRFLGSVGERTYELSHDLVRLQVIDSLSADELQRAHAAVAADLEQSGERPAELVRHLLASGRFARAAEVAVTAAAEAEGKHAFDLAAELYAVAIENCSGDLDRLRQNRARALERAGRYVDAAEEWRKLAASTSGERNTDALLNQAKALLATHHLAAGRRILSEVRQAREGVGRLQAFPAQVLAWLRYRAGPPRMPRHRPRASNDGAAAERDGILAVLVAHFDPMSGFRQLLVARAKCIKGGHYEHAAHVDLVLAYLAYFMERSYGRTRLAERYLESARRLLGGPAQRSQNVAYGIEHIVLGARGMHHARWQEAARAFDEAVDFYESTGHKGTFQHQFALTLRLYADRHKQRVFDYGVTLDAVRSVVQNAQDSALSCHVAFNSALHALMVGNFSGSREVAEEGRRLWQSDEASYQGFLLELACLFADRYGEDAATSRDALLRALRSHARFFPTRSTFGSDTIAHLAFFEAMALHQRSPGSSYRRVLRLARKCANAPAFGTHLAHRAAAYAADAAGRPSIEAIERLRRAESSAMAADQPIDTAIARYQRGLRIGGSERTVLVQSARELIQSVGATPALLDEDWARR